jgi:hypothetical protein
MTSYTVANVELGIDDSIYRIAEHPAAPGLPYGQEGRQAAVYLGEQMEPYAKLSGSAVCRPKARVRQARTGTAAEI